MQRHKYPQNFVVEFLALLLQDPHPDVTDRDLPQTLKKTADVNYSVITPPPRFPNFHI
jgi:hypothetical protein